MRHCDDAISGSRLVRRAGFPFNPLLLARWRVKGNPSYAGQYGSNGGNAILGAGRTSRDAGGFEWV